MNEFELKLTAWVILDDHYHVLIKSHIGVQSTDFIRRFHGRIDDTHSPKNSNAG